MGTEWLVGNQGSEPSPQELRYQQHDANALGASENLSMFLATGRSLAPKHNQNVGAQGMLSNVQGRDRFHFPLGKARLHARRDIEWPTQ